MRNNLDRLGVEHPAPTTEEPLEAIQTKANNEDFSFIISKHLIELPSGGEFYPEGHPLREKPVIEIREMTAKEEDILTNQSYAKDGTLIDRFLSSIIVAPKINVKELLPGDKSALMLWSRIHSLGEEYEAGVACPSCGDSSQRSFNLTEVIKTFTSTAQEGCEKVSDVEFTYTLPRTKASVQFKIYVPDIQKKLEDKIKKYEQYNIQHSKTAEELALVTTSIAGRTENLAKIYEQLPAADIRALKKVIKDLTPSAELMHDFECSSCGFSQELHIPLGVNFFFS